MKKQIDPAAILLSKPGFTRCGSKLLYREPSTLETVLPLPLVNPPTSRGLIQKSLLPFLFLPSRGSARDSVGERSSNGGEANEGASVQRSV